MRGNHEFYRYTRVQQPSRWIVWRRTLILVGRLVTGGVRPRGIVENLTSPVTSGRLSVAVRFEEIESTGLDQYTTMSMLGRQTATLDRFRGC